MDLAVFIKMDPIIGDFTLTSKTAKTPPNPDYENPAIISTTFPRAIKQNEGYEISLKSIAHAPVKNLVRSEFDLVTSTFKEIMWYHIPKTYSLPSRFYESQSDLLMEIYRILGALDDPPPMILYKKDGETTLKFTSSHTIDIHSDIFLNRPFKYNLFEDEMMKTVSRKKRVLDEDATPRKKRYFEASGPNMGLKFDVRQTKVDRIRRLELALEKLHQTWTPMRDYYTDVDFKHITDAYQDWRDQTKVLVSWKLDKRAFEIQLTDANVKLKTFEEKLATLPALVAKTSAIDKEKIKIELDNLKTSINEVTDRANEAQEEYDIVLDRLELKIDKNHQAMTNMVKVLTKELGHDSTQLMATDTSNFVSTKDKAIIRAREITVSSKPIVTTRLGFLYCNVIENSLINNKESRLLCIFPIISKRGYSFYEVREAIYKPISVLQFSTITFTILDSEGDLVEFSLEGDQLTNRGNRKRKYPTLLNLHIQKRL